MPSVPLARLAQLLEMARTRGIAADYLEQFTMHSATASPTPAAVRRALTRVSRAQAQTTDIEQRRVLEWCALVLRGLLPTDAAASVRRSALRLASPGGERRMPEALIHVTPCGGVVYVGAPGTDGKPRNLVLRTVPWVVKELFGLGGATIFVAAGARLQAGTGLPGTDCEFPGYMGKFVRGAQAHLVLFDDEVSAARRTLEISYLGASWGIRRSTMAALYPPGAEVPDLHAEARALESPFPLEGPNGVWAFHALARRGDVTVEGFTLRHLGDARWRVFDQGVLVGDIDLAQYPMPVAEAPPFMESMLANPVAMERRRQALFEGHPMWVPLSGGSGLTQEEASSHLLFDTQGDAMVVDPNIRVVADLARLGIPLDRITRIHITHVHFDHIAGIWSLLRRLPHKPELLIHANAGDIEAIRAGRTDTGELSTLKALCAITEHQSHGALSGADVLDAVTLVPLRFATPLAVGTVHMEFFHAVHSHPTTAYRVIDPASGAVVMLFTGDSRLDADTLAALRADGQPAVSAARVEQLSQQVACALRGGAQVCADAGVLPLHPTPQYYNGVRMALAAQGIGGEALADVLRHLHLYHESAAKIGDAGFHYVGWGWSDAVDLSAQLSWTAPSAAAVDARLRQHGVRRVPLLAELPAPAFERLERMGTVQRLPRGTALIREGEIARSLYVVLDGAVRITKRIGDRDVLIETLTSGVLGEGVVSRERVRNATVTAVSDVVCLEWDADAIAVLQEHGVAARLVELRNLRTLVDGSTGAAPVLTHVGAATRDAILLHADTVRHHAGATIIRENDGDQDLYVVLQGAVQVSAQGGALAQRPVTLVRGAVFGEGALLARGPRPARSATVTALTDVQLFRVPSREAQRLLAEHGGDLQLYLHGLVQERQRELAYATTG